MPNEEKKTAVDLDPFETGRFLVFLLVGLSIFQELIAIFLGDFNIIRIIIGALLLFLIYEGNRWEGNIL